MTQSPDPSVTNYILRAEYESRSSALETRMLKMEAENAQLRTDFNTRLDKVVDKIDLLRDDVYKYRDSSLKTAIGWIISFIVGGTGMVGLLQALHVLR